MESHPPEFYRSIANEYLVKHRLAPDEELKKSVLRNANKETVELLNRTFDESQLITHQVAKILMPGLVTTIRLYQKALSQLECRNKEVETELESKKELVANLLKRLDEYESPAKTANMITGLRLTTPSN